MRDLDLCRSQLLSLVEAAQRKIGKDPTRRKPSTRAAVEARDRMRWVVEGLLRAWWAQGCQEPGA
jgi:hypothetical protein